MAALVVLVIGALWTNAGFINEKPLVTGPVMAPMENQGVVPYMGAIPSQAVTKTDPNPASPLTALSVQEGISHVVSMVKPAVVGVSRMGTARQPAVNTGGLSYLGPYTSENNSIGSGVIIDPRGYVITTFKTVGSDTTVTITLFSADNRNYPADVIAVDPKTDLAVLKIRGNERFATVILGNSDLLEVGDIVFAIGSPFGFSQTVTMGIVSSHNRNLSINGIGYPDMIQTDLAINQGNDGGPLVNVKGEVVGINMATYMPDNHYSGIGFAIPINDILTFIAQNI